MAGAKALKIRGATPKTKKIDESMFKWSDLDKIGYHDLLCLYRFWGTSKEDIKAAIERRLQPHEWEYEPMNQAYRCSRCSHYTGGRAPSKVIEWCVGYHL